ncbi:MAG: bifunctional tRNA (adenosine(37)-N6)-threonylcarbamoyltransferase complex ATPase subunit type 1 TsaE/phosphotransferase [Sideroxydans sp.]
MPDETATANFAARLASVLKPGLMIYLQGDLGAGKTTLVRGLLRALGHEGKVKSPTYTLLEHYTTGELDLCHFDLYRFRDADEWESSGFRDEFDGHKVCLVEWPQQAAGLLPAADITLTLAILPEGRVLTLRADSTTGQECLNDL